VLDDPRPLWRGVADARGLVKHAWHTAAELTGYVITVDRASRRLVLAGRVVASDAHVLAQTPLEFVIPTKYGARRWPIESLTVTEGQLTARLGAQVEDR